MPAKLRPSARSASIVCFTSPSTSTSTVAGPAAAGFDTGQHRDRLALPGGCRRGDAIDAQIVGTDARQGDDIDRHAFRGGLRRLVDGLPDVLATIGDQHDAPPAAERQGARQPERRADIGKCRVDGSWSWPDASPPTAPATSLAAPGGMVSTGLAPNSTIARGVPLGARPARAPASDPPGLRLGADACRSGRRRRPRPPRSRQRRAAVRPVRSPAGPPRPPARPARPAGCGRAARRATTRAAPAAAPAAATRALPDAPRPGWS